MLVDTAARRPPANRIWPAISAEGSGTGRLVVIGPKLLSHTWRLDAQL